ncbi:MAG: DNA cytosine methyltransferase [Myxococcales bacterium]|nr:DNA cytosine methyltransferase [Myxococcales bacterium]
MNELALFAGGGGGILGGRLLGWRTVCAVEFAAYPRSVLLARQADGSLEPFPIWDDVRTFDGHPWRGRVDIVTGGFPCQDISAAGSGAGIGGSRSGLWGEMARIVGEVRPRHVLVENSPMLTSRGLGRVLGDLASLGYNARWGVLGAVHAGAPHQRDRIWIVANASQERCARMADGWLSQPVSNAAPQSCECAQSPTPRSANANKARPQIGMEHAKRDACAVRRQFTSGEWFEVEPDVGRVAEGVAARVDIIATLGNGQVPAVVSLAWNMLAGT